jgi:O-antigen biosynthesis protein
MELRRPTELGPDGESQARDNWARNLRPYVRVFEAAIWGGAYIIRSSLVLARRIISARGITPKAYRKWMRRYDAVTPQLRALMAKEIAMWPSRPLISVIMRSDNVEPERMSQAIESVRNQTYPHWELCISDDASTIESLRPLLQRYSIQDSRVHLVFHSKKGGVSINSNAALDLVHGDYVAIFEATDNLSEDALFWVAREIMLHPDADLLFSDEDKIDHKDMRFDPCFKSAWNSALMLSQNAFRHLGVYRRRLIEEVGRFREGYEGAQDYDLTLRCAAKTTANRIRHIPRVLYHRRALPSSTAAGSSANSYAWEAGRSAISDHLRDARIDALVKPALGAFYQVDYSAPEPQPLVSVLVPTKLDSPVTARCLASVLRETTYENFELLILIHAEHQLAAKSKPYVGALLAHPRVRCVDHQVAPFNFSRVNNLGVRATRGDLLCFVNDDVEVISKDWLEHLVSRVMLEGVGAAGPMLYYPSDDIQHAGVILGAGGVADHAFKKCRRGYSGSFGRGGLEQDYSAVTAACMLIRRNVFEDVGGFDETLPVAFNDVDLCMRIRETGARIVWTPTSEMYHHESVSLGRHNSAQRRQQFRRDVGVLRTRWKDWLENDPCYSPNLSLVHGSMFSLAWPPRVPKVEDILGTVPLVSISRTSELTYKNP